MAPACRAGISRKSFPDHDDDCASRDIRPAHIFRSAPLARVLHLSDPRNWMVSLCATPHLRVWRSVERARAKRSANTLQCCEAIWRGLGVVAKGLLRPAGTRDARQRTRTMLCAARGRSVGGVMEDSCANRDFRGRAHAATRSLVLLVCNPDSRLMRTRSRKRGRHLESADEF